jgi:predicted transcriptional regulator
MIRTDVLKGIITEKGFSQRKVAKELGISEKTFYAKMKKGILNSNEIEGLITLLDIQNPQAVFFAPNGA